MKFQKITPFLWFDTQAEAAAEFYTSVFPRSKITQVLRYGEAGPGPKGQVLTVAFKLNGQDFVALNGGPEYKITPAISLFISCDSQFDVDQYWKILGKGGSIQGCGWLTDRFGVSWQVVPTVLLELLGDPDEAKSQRVMKAMMKMKKLSIAGLEKAAKS